MAYESVLCMKQEVFVYRVPARTTNRGYRAAEWKLDEPDWTGRLKVVSKNRDLCIKLEDKTTGELFAQCPVESYPSAAVEQVLDSSRYFVVRIRDETGRNAFIGLGFADRGDSFDLLVAIQDHFKQVKREESAEQEMTSGVGSLALNDPGPKLDLGFKEGQTIKLNFATKKTGENMSSPSTTKPRQKPEGQGGILLPPPPGGIKIPGPPRISPAAPASSPATSANGNKQLPPPSDLDLLIDLGLENQHHRSVNPFNIPTSVSGNDGWEEFASAPLAKPPTNPQPNHDWVNFD